MADHAVFKKVVELTGRHADRWPVAVLSKQMYRNTHNIIYYHAIWPEGDERLRLFGGVSLERFAADIERLQRFFHFASLDDVIAPALRGAVASEAKPTIALTFDDGFDLVAGGAAKLLADRGISATVFVNTDAYRYDRLIWQHCYIAILNDRGAAPLIAHFNDMIAARGLRAPIRSVPDFLEVTRRLPYEITLELADDLWARAAMPPMQDLMQSLRPYMDLDGLRGWIKMGHHVGFHGRSHLWSSSLNMAGLAHEFLEPGRQLQSELGLGALHMAYGFGDRLQPALEQDVLDSGIFRSALGAVGLTTRGRDARVAERVSADDGLDGRLFGHSTLKLMAANMRLGQRRTG